MSLFSIAVKIASTPTTVGEAMKDPGWAEAITNFESSYSGEYDAEDIIHRYFDNTYLDEISLEDFAQYLEQY